MARSNTSAGGELVIYVNFARGLERDRSRAARNDSDKFDLFVKVYLGKQEFQTPLLEDAGKNPVFGYEKVALWKNEDNLEFDVMELTLAGEEILVGSCKVDMRSILQTDWEGDVSLYRADKKVGKLNAGVEWLQGSGGRSPGVNPADAFAGANGRLPRETGRADPAVLGGSSGATTRVDGRSPRVPGDLASQNQQDLAAQLANIGGDQLQKYAMRLSEVVMQLHASRREDWAEFRARENQLLEELVSSQRLASDRQRLSTEEMRLDQELRTERRRRIDAEVRLTQQDRWKGEALQADRQIRAQRSESYMAMEAEIVECRTFRKKADEYKSEERRLADAQRDSEQYIDRRNQEMTRELRAVQRRAEESEMQSQAVEAQALSRVWRLSGELRSEMEAYDGARATGQPITPGYSPKSPRDAGAGIGSTTSPSSARHALQEIRGVRARVNDLLSELPPA